MQKDQSVYYGPSNSDTGNTDLSCIDLFSGAGGMAEGFRQAGFKIVSANDADPTASKTFQDNFPEARFIPGPIEQLQSEDFLTDPDIAEGDIRGGQRRRLLVIPPERNVIAYLG